MNLNSEDRKQIAARDGLIAGLEKECRIKEELIDAQGNMIKILEEHNADLTQMLDEI